VEAGEHAAAGENVTVAELCERWLRDVVAPRRRPRTRQRYEELLRLHVLPFLGGVRLARLRADDVEAVLTRARERGRSEATCLRVYRVLFAALKRAVRWGLVVRNVAELADPPAPPRFEPRVVLDRESFGQLCAAADEQGPVWGAIVRLTAATGLRRGEVLALTWRDADVEGETISVRRGKTRTSVRAVALSPGTVELLRSLRQVYREQRLRAGSAYVPSEALFADELGEPVGDDRLRGRWRRVVADAGLPGLRFHDLRHFHGTLMLLQLKVPAKLVATRLGHSTPVITESIYAHASVDMGRLAIAGLDEALFGSDATDHFRITSGL